jgi:hypothetical protein
MFQPAKSRRRRSTKNGWSNKSKEPIIVDSEELTQHVENEVFTEEENVPKEGEDKKLTCKYVLWAHDIHNKNWDMDSYKKVCQIDNVSTFWRTFNNLEKLGIRFMHLFLMKDGILPIWEDPKNRDGGVCSLRLEIDKAKDVFEDLNVRMLCEILNDNPTDINGISMSPKNSWVIIKVWNADSKNDLSVTLSKEILNKYADLSIKYRSNEPEY